MEHDVMGTLLRIESAQGRIEGKIEGILAKQEDAEENAVRLWGRSGELERRIIAAETRLTNARAWVAGATATGAFIWFLVEKVMAL